MIKTIIIETNKKLNIEIRETSNNAMSYDEAVLYCFLLGDGWRMPTREEYRQVHSICGWFKNRVTEIAALGVTPVRDLKDD